MSNSNYCNFCKYASSVIFTTPTRRYNLYCKHDNQLRNIELSVDESKFVTKPIWCPLANTNKCMTYTEQIDALKKIKPLISWSEIQVNETYHIPQIPGEERKTILITSKTASQCSYKVLNSDMPNIIYTIFPTSPIANFLVKDKLRPF